MYATGLGSLPGTDFRGALGWVLETLAPHTFWPELPARGAESGMIGRAVGLLDSLGADLQPSGWRLIAGSSADQHRAQAQWRHDLDDVEELLQGYEGSLRVAVAGPWTLAACVDRPLGDKVLSDHGARRDLAESLASGVAGLVEDLHRRLPAVEIVVQLDEPLLPAVVSGGVPTASGFSRLRAVDRPEVVAGLGEAGENATALHCCAAGLDLSLVSAAGIRQVCLDAGVFDKSARDGVGRWLDEGRDLVLGVVDTTTPHAVSVDDVVRRTLRILAPFDLDPRVLVEHVAISPACGLAGWDAPRAKQALSSLARAVPVLEEQLG